MNALYKELTNYKRCKICDGESFEVLDTYKHLWVMCLDCKNVKSFRKSKYLLEHQPLKQLLVMSTKIFTKRIAQIILNQFLPLVAVKNDDSKFYELYAELCRLPYESTRFKALDDQFLQLLDSVGIDLTGKTILSISEGPGFIAQRLTGVAREIVITEYNYKAVDAMRTELGITAYKYDFNSDKLSDIFENKTFDLIFMRSCMAFCNDLESLAKEIKKVLNKDGYFFTMFHTATTGGCLQWMHDEYTPNNWYNPESVLRIFYQEGFRSLYPYTKFKCISNPKREYRNTFYTKALFNPFWWYYFLKSKFYNKYFNRETNEVSYSLFLQRKQF